MIMTEQKYRKLINFDIDTNKLKQHGFKNTAPAYVSLRKVLGKLGFLRNQYSCYISTDELRAVDIYDVLTVLAKELPWFPACIQKIFVTSVIQEFDVTNALITAATSLTEAEEELPSADNP